MFLRNLALSTELVGTGLEEGTLITPNTELIL